MKKNVCKSCKGTGMVGLGNGVKGLTRCPCCNGSGVANKCADMSKKK